MKKFTVIAAIDQRRGLGKDGKIPWRLPGEMAHFRQLTTQAAPGKYNAVIMGNATWFSLPPKFKPLPDRLNIVLSRNPIEVPAGVRVTHSLDEARQVAEADPQVERVFIIGGGSVYAQTINHPDCQEILLTEIDADFDCDTFFPPIPGQYTVSDQSNPVLESGVTYRFLTYVRST